MKKSEAIQILKKWSEGTDIRRDHVYEAQDALTQGAPSLALEKSSYFAEQCVRKRVEFERRHKNDRNKALL